MITDTLGEVLSMFQKGSTSTLAPELKDCLVSLDANSLSFCWKDAQMERLSTFRKFLLNEFGTYQSAWTYITRGITMPRSLGTRNVSLILRQTLEQIEDVDAIEAAKAEEEERLQREALEKHGGNVPDTILEV